MAAQDVLFIGVVVFAAAVGLFVLSFTSNIVLQKVANSTAISANTQAQTAINNTRTAVLPKTDYLVTGFFLALVLGLIITSWFIAGNPIFIFIYILVIAIGVIVAAIISNTWESITTNSVFGTYITTFPKTNHILSYLPFYLVLVGVIGLIVMYAKPYLSGGGDGGHL